MEFSFAGRFMSGRPVTLLTTQTSLAGRTSSFPTGQLLWDVAACSSNLHALARLGLVQAIHRKTSIQRLCLIKLGIPEEAGEALLHQRSDASLDLRPKHELPPNTGPKEAPESVENNGHRTFLEGHVERVSGALFGALAAEVRPRQRSLSP